MLPGGGQRDVSIQGREQPLPRTGGFPPQRERSGLIACRLVPRMHPGQPGYTPDRTRRTDPGQAGKPLAVGFRGDSGERAVVREVRQSRPGSIKAGPSCVWSLANIPSVNLRQ